MKINLKNKKVIAGIAGIAVVIAAVGIFISAKENGLRNAQVEVISTPKNIEMNIIDNKKLFNDIEESLKKSSIQEAKFIQIEEAIKAIEDTNFKDETKINEQIKVLDSFNNELDKALDIYRRDEELKKDVILVDKMEEGYGLNIFIDNLMHEFNTQIAENFNQDIKKFPGNIFANYRQWNTVNKFKSISI